MDSDYKNSIKKTKIFIMISGIFGAVVLTALVTYFIVKQYNPNNQTQQSNTFSVLTQPKTPPFIQGMKTDTGVKVDFHYDGDYTPQRDYFGGSYEYYTPPGTNEKFLSLSKLKNRENLAYGSQSYLSIFKSEESHSYQGTPIYITNLYDKNSLAYLGFNINDKSLISELKVELGIDYNAAYWADAEKNSFISSLLGFQTAYACGPGIYLRKVGDSELDFVQESDGILWYKLRTAIALYDIRLIYSDQDCSTIPSYCKEQADDPQECNKYFSCYYNTSIPDLTKGNLRMHIYYKPNDKEGLLRLQVANIILSDIAGTFYQATMGEDFSHYYRAYLH